MKAAGEEFKLTDNLYPNTLNPPRLVGTVNVNVIVVAVDVFVHDITGALNVAVSFEIANAGEDPTELFATSDILYVFMEPVIE